MLALLAAAGSTNMSVIRRSVMFGKRGGKLGRGLATDQLNVWKGMKTADLLRWGF